MWCENVCFFLGEMAKVAPSPILLPAALHTWRILQMHRPTAKISIKMGQSTPPARAKVVRCVRLVLTKVLSTTECQRRMVVDLRPILRQGKVAEPGSRQRCVALGLAQREVQHKNECCNPKINVKPQKKKKKRGSKEDKTGTTSKQRNARRANENHEFPR